MNIKTKVSITVLFSILFAAMFTSVSSGAVPLKDIQKMQKATPAKATVTPKKPRKLLVFDLCKGSKHSSIPYWDKTLEIIGNKTGAYKTVVSNDMNMFKAENLKQFDAVCLNNTTKLKFSPEQRKSLMDFVKGGKGIVGIHAGVDNFDDWPEARQMMGGYFTGHPWSSGGIWAVKLDEPDHPLNKAFNGKDFKVNDEIYLTDPPIYSRGKQLVLTSLDMTDQATRSVKGLKPTDMDTGISWVKNYGKGRVFHGSLGHNHHITWNPAILQHYLDGIQFALGDLIVEATPGTQKALKKLLVKIADYDYGKSRADLTKITNFLRYAENKQQLEEPLAAFLRSDATLAAKQFVCKKLTTIGTEQSVPTLAAMLTNDKTSDMARFTLERIPGQSVDKALLKALKKTSGKTKAGIINTLGQRRVKNSVTVLCQLVYNTDTDSIVSRSAISALGKIADSSAANALAMAKKKISKKHRELWADAYLLCADKYLADGNAKKAKAIYEELYSKKESSVTRKTAFNGLVLASGKKAVSLVVEALTNADPTIQAVAIKFVGKLAGENATKAFVKQLPKMTAPGKVLLLESLSKRGDKAALPVIVTATNDRDSNVRTAALRALGILGDARHVVQLAQKAAKAKGDESKAARQSLYRLRGDNVDKTIISSITKADSKVKLELVRSIGKRGLTTANQTLLKSAKDADSKVRQESFKVLKTTAGPKYLPELVNLLIVGSGREQKEAVKAIVIVAKKIPDQNRRAASVLAAMASVKKTDAKCSLLRVLGKIGDDNALPQLRSSLKDKNSEVRDAAIRALSEWPNAKPLDDLFRIVKGSKNKTNRVLSLRGLVRMIGLDQDHSAKELLKMYKEVMALASDTNEKKTALSGLGEIQSPDALQTAVDLLKNKALRQEAAIAAVKISKAIYDDYSDQSVAAMETILKVSGNESIRKQAKEVIQLAERFEDFVVTWQMSGPYDESILEHFDYVYPPEKPMAENVVWKPVPISSSKGQPYIVDLKKLLGGNNRAAYLRTNVLSDKERMVFMELGSDDGVKVWLNGKVVWKKNLRRPCKPGDDKVKVTLRKGLNTVMLKIPQGGGGWGACMRIRNLEGRKVKGLKIKLPE